MSRTIVPTGVSSQEIRHYTTSPQKDNIDTSNLFSMVKQIISRLKETNETLETADSALQAADYPSNAQSSVPPQSQRLFDLLEEAIVLVSETSRLSHSITAKIGNQ